MNLKQDGGNRDICKLSSEGNCSFYDQIESIKKCSDDEYFIGYGFEKLNFI